MIEMRQAGEMVTLETRSEAHERVDKRKRYSQIIECLMESGGIGLTAKECAVIMAKKGYIPTSERNFTAPRLTEMGEQGIVEPIGKTKCAYTGRTVSIWALRRR